MAFGDPPTNGDLQAMQDIYDRYISDAEVKIDKHALDDELANQAMKYRDVAEAVADCISYGKAAKDYFDQIEAALASKIREDHDADHAGESKPPRLTDTAVLQMVATNVGWQDAKALRRRWEDILGRMQKLEETYKQRSSNMKELPTLYASGYWQTNSSDGRTRAERTAEHTREELDRRREAGAGSNQRRRPRD